ncbi:MAG: DUF6789 family protein [Fidelibacterota bacterium]
MKFNAKKVVIAGLVGTLAMTMLMLLGPMMGIPKMDMGNMLGKKNPFMELPYTMGWIMHFIIGIVLTGIYAGYIGNILPSSGWKKGLIFGIIPFFVAQLMVMPMMGMGVFTGGNILMIMGSLMGHLVFGGVTGLVYGEG